MADIAASDVTYTLNRSDNEPGRGLKNDLTLAFGDGALTYGVGGIPLDAGKMGLPVGVIHEFSFTDPASDNGLGYKYDESTNSIRIYNSSGSTPAGSIAAGVIAVTAGVAGDAVTNNAGVLESTGGQDLAVNAQTFTGTPVAAGALAEFSGAPVAATLKIHVEGY